MKRTLLILACLAACKPTGPASQSFELAHRRFIARFPVAPEATERITHPQRWRRLIGYRFVDRSTFGTVSIESVEPPLMPVASVQDYKVERVPDGDQFSWWVPGVTSGERRYSYYVRRTIEGITLSCGGMQLSSSQVEPVKAICMSLKTAS